MARFFLGLSAVVGHDLGVARRAVAIRVGAHGDPRPGAEPFEVHPSLLSAVGDRGPVGGVVRLLRVVVSVVSGGIFHLRGRSGGSSVPWPLFVFLRIRRPARTEGRAPGGVYAGSDPAVAAARAGRAGQFLKKVNWNGSPMKISRPPGIVAANA